jgi:hypothetical protein
MDGSPVGVAETAGERVWGDRLQGSWKRRPWLKQRKFHCGAKVAAEVSRLDRGSRYS